MSDITSEQLSRSRTWFNEELRRYQRNLSQESHETYHCINRLLGIARNYDGSNCATVADYRWLIFWTESQLRLNPDSKNAQILKVQAERALEGAIAREERITAAPPEITIPPVRPLDNVTMAAHPSPIPPPSTLTQERLDELYRKLTEERHSDPLPIDTASIEENVRRAFEELSHAGVTASIQNVREQIERQRQAYRRAIEASMRPQLPPVANEAWLHKQEDGIHLRFPEGYGGGLIYFRHNAICPDLNWVSGRFKGTKSTTYPQFTYIPKGDWAPELDCPAHWTGPVWREDIKHLKIGVDYREFLGVIVEGERCWLRIS